MPWAGAERRKLLVAANVTMDRAYEGNDTHGPVVKLGAAPVVPPKSNRKEPWGFATKWSARLKALKGVRRTFTRHDNKLAVAFVSFIYLALVIDALR